VHDGGRTVLEKDCDDPGPVIDRATLETDVHAAIPEDEPRLAPEVSEIVDDHLVASVEQGPGHICPREASPARNEDRS
jgi:hypothetical protein